MESTDGEIVGRSRTEPEAFGEIFDRHFKIVYRFCARRVGSSQSEDLAGDVFRKAFERRELYHTAREDARPWLLAIARNLIRDGLRSHAIRQVAADTPNRRRGLLSRWEDIVEAGDRWQWDS